MDTLESLRKEIDKLHEDLRELLLRRRDLTLAIWKIKKEKGSPLIVPEREKALLDQFLNHDEIKNDPEFEQAMRNLMGHLLTEYKNYLMKVAAEEGSAS